MDFVQTAAGFEVFCHECGADGPRGDGEDLEEAAHHFASVASRAREALPTPAEREEMRWGEAEHAEYLRSDR